ncbi:unnamed protein product [Phytophthora lilii]|uniref:Unnamed protein product n=1 Tax=Phytophthora lilii TaxID=2077276 RepID=A0A9W6TGM8_9STRA|nr:unnamed protein product [Phytophthora lilii]
MQLSEARSVLEVGAGPGIGSLDILKHMATEASACKKPKKLVVTDLSPVMVRMAREMLADAANAVRDTVDVQIAEANGEAVVCERVLTTDGLAGFTIWGKPQHFSKHSLSTAVSHELGLEHGWDTRSFELGRDLSAFRTRFASAGFSQVRIWPFMCVLELWSGEAFAAFYCQQSVVSDAPDLRARAFAIATKLADEY